MITVLNDHKQATAYESNFQKEEYLDIALKTKKIVGKKGKQDTVF